MRTKAKIKIAHTAAFELYEEGTCQAAKESGNKKEVYCKQPETCRKGDCYCQLFRRAIGAAEDDPWLVAGLDRLHEAKNEPDKYEYKCLCVKPILETTHTEEGVQYKTRFQLCEEMGLCSLENFCRFGRGTSGLHGEIVARTSASARSSGWT